MRLTRKLIVATTCAILVVLGVNAVVRVQREVALFETDVRRDSRLLGRTLAGAVARVWTTVGESEALDLVEDADARESHLAIRWVPPDDAMVSADVHRRLDGGAEVVVERRSDGGSALYTYVPVSLGDRRLGAIELRESMADEHAYVRRTIVQAIVTTAVLVLVCGLLATVLGVLFVGRPVRRLVEHARRIGAGDLSAVEPPRQRDEIGELGHEMNAMCERLSATRDQLRHADRLTTVGKLAAGVAHEIGTPLNVITGHAQIIREDFPDDESARENAAIIAEQAGRVAHIVRQLLDFARPRALNKGRHDLAALAREAANLLEPLARKRGVAIELADAAAIEVEVDGPQIHQVLTNLIVNAIQAQTAGGAVRIAAGRGHARPPAARDGERACARLVVEDDGPGMTAEARARVFEPFYTTKEVGEGTGLGLSVAHGIVAEHGGWIEVDSELGKGARFTVYLPL